VISEIWCIWNYTGNYNDYKIILLNENIDKILNRLFKNIAYANALSKYCGSNKKHQAKISTDGNNRKFEFLIEFLHKDLNQER